MPSEPPPRPGPLDKVLILHRRPKSGFVNYPPFFQKRMVDGRARFMTKCDMLIGPCACGYTHYEWEGWVDDMLQMYNCQIEILILWGSELGDRGMVVEIPGYWKQGRNWERPRCDVLVGQCTCGRTHVASERWVRTLLNKHRTVILNMPEIEAPTPEPEPERARRSRRSSRPTSRGSSRQSRARVRVTMTEERAGVRVQGDGDSGAVEELVAQVLTGDMPLPTDIQTRLSNNDTAMPNCDCSDCERLRERDLLEAARVWVRDSVAMSQDPPSRERGEWEASHSNELGDLPGWCNCDSCRDTRIQHRSLTEGSSPVAADTGWFTTTGDNAWWRDEPTDEATDEASEEAPEQSENHPITQIQRFMNSVTEMRSDRTSSRTLSGERFWVPPPERATEIAEAEVMVDLNMESLVDEPSEGGG